MDELDNKALNATETPNARHYVISPLSMAFILFAIVAFAALMLMKHCGYEKQKETGKEQHLIDSLNTIHAIEVKQLNHAQMVLMNNINDSDKRNQMLVNENKALQERSNLQTVQYTNVINRIKQSAPIPCQIYIDSVDVECAKVVNAKDDVIDGLITRLDNRDSTIVDRDSLIAVKQARIETDSSNCKVNLDAKDKKIADLGKENKWQKRWANFGKGVVKVGATIIVVGTATWAVVKAVKP